METRDYAHALMPTETYEASRTEGKKIETLFGRVKHVLSLVRFRWCGLSKSKDKFLLIHTVQNLERQTHHCR